MFVVLYIFISSFFHFIFNIKSKRTLAFKKLLSTSFNVQEKHRYQFKVLISGIKKTYYLPIIEFPVVLQNKTLVYDVNTGSKQDRLNYLQDLYPNLTPLQFVSAQELTGYKSKTYKVLFLISTLPIQLGIIFFGSFKKDKSGINSVLSNLLITRNVLNLIKGLNVTDFILFSAYDTNSAFLTVNLQYATIHVTTVTSEVPLYKWNSVIVTDTLHICSSYQEQELNQLPQIIYKTLKFGAPEKYFEVKDLYKELPSQNFKLGFISTGGWVRNKLGHIDQGIDIEFFEKKILNDLNSILIELNHVELIIYPHPRELNFFKGSQQELLNFYKNTLPDINFSINFSGKPTHKLFNECYLAICFMSTSIFERVYAKRKSATVYFKEDIYPVKFSSNYFNCIFTQMELKELIKRSYPI